MEYLQRLSYAGATRDVIARVPKAHFEHAEAARIGIDDEEVLLGHCTLLSAAVCEWVQCHVKHAFPRRT
jgi:hypothetical protein